MSILNDNTYKTGISRTKKNGMSLNDIKQSLRGVKDFGGVFLKNERLPPQSCKLIINLDSTTPSTNGTGNGGMGTHWCALSYDMYFDPFGAPPPEELKSRVVKYWDNQIQQLDSDVCGEICCYFLKHTTKNMSDPDITKLILGIRKDLN